MRTLKQYVRDGKRQKVGVLLCGALPTGEDDDDNSVVVGYSFCNTKKDTFNHLLGHRIAANRGNNAYNAGIAYFDDSTLLTKITMTAPGYAVKQMTDFCHRCFKYFKTDKLLIL